MNCHGYSTGKGYWLNDFDLLMKDDYTKCFCVGDLATNAVYGSSAHSIKIAGVNITATPYQITTREKYRDSGVYERQISPVADGGSDGPASEAVALDLKTVQWNGRPDSDPTNTSVSPPFDHFFKEK
jgi:hypothetical protein